MGRPGYLSIYADKRTQKIFDEFTGFTQEIKDFSKQIIDSIDLTSKKISEETTSVDSIADVVNSFGGKIDKLNKK